MRLKKNRGATAIVTSITKKPETIKVDGFNQTYQDKKEDAKEIETPEKKEVMVQHSLDERQVDLMMDLVEVPTHTGDTKKMRTFIRSELHKIPDTMFWTHDGNIYVIRGDADLYPCIVAHTDTVHRNQHDIRCFQYGDMLFAMDGKKMEQTGTGGDDKVGIWIALECLRKFKNLKVVFFRDEENGCQGSGVANMDFFKNTTLVLQCDRRGRSDITESISGLQMVTDEFKKAIAHLVLKYKRTWVDGMFTDVLKLAEKKLSVCCMNMACGYYSPHTDSETIDLLHMQETYDFVCEIITSLGEKQWLIQDRKHKYANTYSTYRGGEDYGWEWEGSFEHKKQLPAPKGTEEVDLDDAFLRRDGTWVSKRTGKPIHIESVVEDDFRTGIKDYCENCGSLLVTKKELELSHCAKCVEILSGNKINVF